MNQPTTALKSAKGILFDMDGVLVDSEPTHAAAIVALSGEQRRNRASTPPTVHSSTSEIRNLRLLGFCAVGRSGGIGAR